MRSIARARALPEMSIISAARSTMAIRDLAAHRRAVPGGNAFTAVRAARRRRLFGDCAPPPRPLQKRRRAACWELISPRDIPHTHVSPRPVMFCSAFRASHLHLTKALQPCKKSRNAPTAMGRTRTGPMSGAICAHGVAATKSHCLPFVAGLPPQCGGQSSGWHWRRQDKEGRTRNLQLNGASHAIWQPAKLIRQASRSLK